MGVAARGALPASARPPAEEQAEKTAPPGPRTASAARSGGGGWDGAWGGVDRRSRAWIDAGASRGG